MRKISQECQERSSRYLGYKVWLKSFALYNNKEALYLGLVVYLSSLFVVCVSLVGSKRDIKARKVQSWQRARSRATAGHSAGPALQRVVIIPNYSRAWDQITGAGVGIWSLNHPLAATLDIHCCSIIYQNHLTSHSVDQRTQCSQHSPTLNFWGYALHKQFCFATRGIWFVKNWCKILPSSENPLFICLR